MVAHQVIPWLVFGCGVLILIWTTWQIVKIMYAKSKQPGILIIMYTLIDLTGVMAISGIITDPKTSVGAWFSMHVNTIMETIIILVILYAIGVIWTWPQSKQ